LGNALGGGDGEGTIDGDETAMTAAAAWFVVRVGASRRSWLVCGAVVGDCVLRVNGRSFKSFFGVPREFLSPSGA